MGTYTILVTFLVILVSLQYIAAIRCLSCNDVIQPRYCSGIEHCPEGDACVTESYRNRNGEYLYNVGCMSAQRCSLTTQHNRSANFLRSDIIGTHVHDVCTECCHSDLCNAAGCGTNGFPQQRGPVCLDCPQSRDPADCDVISVCLPGEVCHVEEIYKFGDVFYKTSCSRKTDYQCDPPPVYNPVEVGRRSTGRGNCFFCCPDDLCNTKCHASTSVVQTTTSSTTHAPISQSNAATSLAPSTVQTTLAPSTVQTTLAPSTVQTTLAPSTVQTTLAPSTIQTALAPLHSFKGKEFFLMYMANFKYSALKLSVNITSDAPSTQIQVITRGNSTSKLVFGPANHLDIDANMTMRENGKTSKGIIITSNTSISVTSLNAWSASADGYFALPIECLGVSYIVGTFISNNDDTTGFERFGPSFAVGAPYDNTVVNITLSTSGVSVLGQNPMKGDTITVVLDRLDTFYIATHYYHQDLTGTRIVSDKPVAVVSGNSCSQSERYGCNHLVEYLPPVSKWGSRFMVPPIMSSTSGIIRIISSVNNTSAVVTAQTSNKTYTISTFIDIDTNPSQPYAISSDQPVLVLLIFYTNHTGMSVVPSRNQFSSDNVLVSPPIASLLDDALFDNHIVVSIRFKDQSGLQLRSFNGTDLPRVGSVNFPDTDGEMYSFISVTCNNNQTCSVRHADGSVMFSVLSYGFTHYAAYAYPVNLML